MQKRRIYFILIVFASILFLQNNTFAQSREVKKKQKETEKVKIQQKKEIEKSQEKERKVHFSRQTKDVQKRMKESKKKAKTYNKQGKKSILQRLFHFRNKYN